MCAMIRNLTQVSQSWTAGVNHTDHRLPWPFCATPWPLTPTASCVMIISGIFPLMCADVNILASVEGWGWRGGGCLSHHLVFTPDSSHHLGDDPQSSTTGPVDTEPPWNLHTSFWISTPLPFHTSLFLTRPWSVKKTLSSMFHATAAAATLALLAGFSRTPTPSRNPICALIQPHTHTSSWTHPRICYRNNHRLLF